MADCFIDFKCTQQLMQRVDNRTVAAGAAGCVYARFELCSKWDGLNLCARFEYGQAVYDVIMSDNAALIPHEVLQHNGFNVSIYGEDGAGARLTSNQIFVPVERSVDVEGVPPIPASPTLIEQFFDEAQAAVDVAASVREDANNGLFNGKPFRVVKTYSSVAEMQDDLNGTDVEANEFVMINSGVDDPDNAKLYMKVDTDGVLSWSYICDLSGATGVGVKGDKGDTGDTGATGERGQQGARGEDGAATSGIVSALVVDGAYRQNGTPTPAAPVPVEVITGSVGVVSCGKNFIPKFTYNNTVNGVSIIASGDGSITISGTATATIDAYVFAYWAERGNCIIPAGTYVLSGMPRENKQYLKVALFRDGQLSKELSTSLSGILPVSGTTTAQTDGLSVAITMQAGVTVNTTIYPQLEKGTTATAYEPHSETATTVDLQGHELAALPNGTKDTLEVDAAGRVTLTQRVGKVVLNGSEDFWKYGTTGSANTYAVANVLDTAAEGDFVTNTMLCTGFKQGAVPWNNAATNIFNNSGATSTNFLYFNTALTIDTAEQFKQMLATSPVTVYYPLATTVTVDLGRVAPPRPDGNNYAVSNVETQLHVEQPYYGNAAIVGLVHLNAGMETVNTTGTGSAYKVQSATVAAEPENGARLMLIPHANSSVLTPTLSVNNGTAYPIQRRLSTNSASMQPLTSLYVLRIGDAIEVMFDGTCGSWILVNNPRVNATDIYDLQRTAGQLLYPVGSVYIGTQGSAVSPAAMFGGTWSQSDTTLAGFGITVNVRIS